MEETTTEQLLPLFPDDIEERHYECWICGEPCTRTHDNRPGLAPGTYKCKECDVTWTVRYGTTREADERFMISRDQRLEKATKSPLVDFTQPDAPSAPA